MVSYFEWVPENCRGRVSVEKHLCWGGSSADETGTVLFTEDTFQDPQWLPETMDSTGTL